MRARSSGALEPEVVRRSRRRSGHELLGCGLQGGEGGGDVAQIFGSLGNHGHLLVLGVRRWPRSTATAPSRTPCAPPRVSRPGDGDGACTARSPSGRPGRRRRTRRGGAGHISRTVDVRTNPMPRRVLCEVNVAPTEGAVVGGSQLPPSFSGRSHPFERVGQQGPPSPRGVSMSAWPAAVGRSARTMRASQGAVTADRIPAQDGTTGHRRPRSLPATCR